MSLILGVYRCITAALKNTNDRGAEVVVVFGSRCVPRQETS